MTTLVSLRAKRSNLDIMSLRVKGCNLDYMSLRATRGNLIKKNKNNLLEDYKIMI